VIRLSLKHTVFSMCNL